MERNKIASIREKADAWWERNQFRVYLTTLLMLLVLLFLWPRIFITVPAGHQGVMYRRFHGGTVTSRIWGEGFHIIPPWDTLKIYETRLQERTLKFPVLSQEGLEIILTVSIRFYPIIESLGHLHQDIGPDYFTRLIKPEVESHLRKTIGDRTAYQLYSNEGDILQEASRLDMAAVSGVTSYIRIDELLIRYVVLPKVVNDAIETKHREEQRVMEYEYRVRREEQEAERKRIEATGIRDYNHIAKKVSPDLLRWRGIDATLQLAKSANSKIVIVGNSKDGLPLILDTNTTDPQDTRAENPQIDDNDDMPPNSNTGAANTGAADTGATNSGATNTGAGAASDEQAARPPLP